MPELIEYPDPNIYSAYGIYLLRGHHPLVRKLKRYYRPVSHGTRAWGSSFLLMDFLQENPPKKNAKIVDVGCGWGPVSVYATVQLQANVTAVDSDTNVFPFLDLLAALNDVKVDKLNKKFDQVQRPFLQNQDLMIGSDICYWDEHVKLLFNLVNRALTAGVSRVVLSDPGRKSFYQFVELCQKKKSWETEIARWFSLEPHRATGEIVEIRLNKSYTME